MILSAIINEPKIYARVLAKIGAERSKLVSEAKIRSLTEMKDLAAFAGQLRDTAYQAQIAKAPLPLTSRKLERAFNENLIESEEKIIKNSPSLAAQFLKFYVLRFEVENIKVLIKAANADFTPEQKLAKMYLSVEDFLKNRSVIEDAAKVSGVKQIVNTLKNTVYGPYLNVGLQNYEETGFTSRLDLLLDKAFFEKRYESYQRLSKDEKPHAFYYASMENDGFVLLALLRGKEIDHEVNLLRQAMPHTDFISNETVEGLLSAPDFESALKIAMESHYGKFFAKAATPEEVIANAGKAFRRALFEHAKASRVSENFNIGAALAFMTQKETEVRNLVALSSGIEAAVNPETIQTQLSL